MPIANWEKFGVPEQLHIILNGMYIFFGKHKKLPASLDQNDANELVEIVKEYQSNKMEIEDEVFKVNSVDEKLIRNVALYAHAQISPTSSFWGGIITQEIVKMTGKYSPLRQWLHHDFFEVLPTTEVQRTISPLSRYSDYALLFGD